MRARGEGRSIVAALTEIQEREGWLPEENLRALSRELGEPLHRIESVSTFYTHFRRTRPAAVSVEVCRDLPCMLAGGAEPLPSRLRNDDGVEVRTVSCLGRCDRAPASILRGGLIDLRDPAALEAALHEEPVALRAEPGPNWAAELYRETREHYDTLQRALAGEPHALIRTLQDSGLRGMGGAGFPTGRKWASVAAEPATPRYVICNADESEPGTFKDRQILSDLPHLVIEGTILAAFACGARRGWVFIRHEYAPERLVLEQAIADAYARGALGRGILGSGFDFDLEVFVSPGGYILGEETALLECMEDRRGEPRNKPPFPSEKGLYGQPTLMNNVETLVHATGIVRNGVDWWRGLGRDGFSGHKFISVSGDVARPQVALVPFGTTLRELLAQCGGMRDGAPLAVVAPGGASSRFLGPEALDTRIDFDTLQTAGSMLGSGAAIYVAEGRDLVEVGLNVARFFRNESCGKCVPCRVGCEKAVQLLEREPDPASPSPKTRALLGELDSTLAKTSLCGLGHVALGPLLSLLEGEPAS